MNHAYNIKEINKYFLKYFLWRMYDKITKEAALAYHELDGIPENYRSFQPSHLRLLLI